MGNPILWELFVKVLLECQEPTNKPNLTSFPQRPKLVATEVVLKKSDVRSIQTVRYGTYVNVDDLDGQSGDSLAWGAR